MRLKPFLKATLALGMMLMLLLVPLVASATNQTITPTSVGNASQVVWKATPTLNVAAAGADTLKISPFSIADGITYVPYDTTGASTTAKIRYREVMIWVTGATSGIDSLHVGLFMGADATPLAHAARFKTLYTLASETIHLNTSATAYLKVYIPEGFSVLYPYVFNKDATTSGKFTIWFAVSRR